jgi:hypothetical protein
MVTSTRYIPNDVVLYIMDLIPDDIPTLSACNSTSRIFHSHCQKRLFSSVEINLGYEQRSRNLKLAQIAEASQGIGEYTRTLLLIFGDPYDVEEDIILFLLRFTGLRRIEMGPPTMPCMTIIDWGKFSPSLKESLLTLMDLETLRRLDLRSFESLPWSAILANSVSKVEVLVLEYIRGLDIEHDSRQPLRSSIKSLTMIQCLDLSAVLKPIMELSGVENIDTLMLILDDDQDLTDEELFIVNKLIQDVAHNLMNFSFMVNITKGNSRYNENGCNS